MNTISNHIRSNVVGYIALFFALSGSAYALRGSNTVFSDDIVNGQVSSADVRNDSSKGGGLTAADLRAGSVGTSEVASNQIFSSDVSDDTLSGGGLTAADLRLGSVMSSEVRDDTVTGGGLAAADLGAGSVGSSEVADNQIFSSEVSDDTLSGGGLAAIDLQAGSVGTSEVQDNSLTPGKLSTIPAVRADTHWTPGFYCSEQMLSSGSEVPIKFPTESFDTANMHSAASCTDANSEKLVAPRDGIYQVSAGVHWLGNAIGYRQITLVRHYSGPSSSYLTSQSTPALQGAPAPDQMQEVSTIVQLSQGDTVELLGFQSSGGSLQIAKGDSRNYLAMAWIGPS